MTADEGRSSAAESETGEGSDEGSLGLLAASPLGDVLLGAAVCVAGAIVVTVLRRSPLVFLVLGVVAVVTGALVLGRRAARAGRRWSLRAYLVVGAMLAVGLALGIGLLLYFWILLCGC